MTLPPTHPMPLMQVQGEKENVYTIWELPLSVFVDYAPFHAPLCKKRYRQLHVRVGLVPLVWEL